MASQINNPRARFFDANGNPLSGGKVFSFGAGTTTPKATFTDQAGLTANANPTILDANGEANIWLSGAYKIELRNSVDVVQWVVDNVKEASTDVPSGFFALTVTPTTTGSASFTVPGDFTTTLFVNQRIRYVTSSVTRYATIASSIFGSGVTTVTTTNSTGPLNTGTGVSVAAGISETNFNIDAAKVSFDGDGAGGNVETAMVDRARLSVTNTYTGGNIYNNQLRAQHQFVVNGVLITAASTTDLPAANATNITISGNTTINSFGVPIDGEFYILQFTGAPLITATSGLINLHNNANHQVKAGEIFLAQADVTAGGYTLDLIRPAAQNAGMPSYYGNNLDLSNGTQSYMITHENLKRSRWSVAAWANYAVSGGAPTLVGSRGIGGITDGGVGNFSININPAMLALNYAVGAWAVAPTAADAAIITGYAGETLSINDIQFRITNSAGTLTDPSRFTFMLTQGN